jgi:saccharopine dehydrogenase-like NADP-dependent oxidoreductase
MKIGVIGGAGQMALGSIRDFIECDAVDEVKLADLDARALKQRRKELGSGKLTIQEIDLTDADSLADFLRGCDVCLNGTLPKLNVVVMRGCLEAGCHYTDYGGLFHWAKDQMGLSEDFRSAGLAAVVGSGAAPGMVNVMAGYAEQRLETVESVRIRAGIVDLGVEGAPFVPPYSLETLVEECAMSPWVFEDGDWKELEPFEGAEEILFPEPVGLQTAFCTIHSEPYTIPVSFRHKGIRQVNWKLALPKEFEQKLRFLVAIGCTDKEPIPVDGVAVSPRALLDALIERSLSKASTSLDPDDHMVLRVEVKGLRGGKEHLFVLEAELNPYEPWNKPCIAFSVGFPAAVTCRMLGDGTISARGALGSEVAVPPEPYFRELAKRGIRIGVTEKSAL